MSRFLRNVIVAARDPDTSLRPRVPSLYADPGGRSHDAREAEPLFAEGVASTRDGREELDARPSPQGSTDAARVGRRQPGMRDETMPLTGEHDGRPATSDPATRPASGLLLPRLMEQTTRVDGPARHPATTLRNGQPESFTQADAASPRDSARASAGARRPRAAQSLDEASVSIKDPRGVDDQAAARAPLQPLPREPGSGAAARVQPVAAPSTQHSFDPETRAPRAGIGRSASPSHDVEIHIGRIEVIAAAPAVPAPPASAHKSPSLGDYLNGRRRPRT